MTKRRWTGLLSICLSAVLMGCQASPEVEPDVQTATSVDARVLKLEELTYTNIDELDRETAIFFLTFGNLEEHGPHLPVGSDFFQSVGLRDGVIARLHTTHPDATFVTVPVVPLGEGGFNNYARQFDHVGTFGVRFTTLRDVAVDLGAAIASKGFRNIFLVHFHGAPLHNIAFTQAAAFVSERYDVRMVNLSSLAFSREIFSAAVQEKYLGDNWAEEIGMTGHAGTAETSTNLYLRGELVKPDYENLPPFLVKDMTELGRIYERPEFLGYMSDPSKASAQMGEALMNEVVERATRLAERSLSGDDLSGLPVYPDGRPIDPGVDETTALVQERYAEQAAAIDAWLSQQQSVQP